MPEIENYLEKCLNLIGKMWKIENFQENFENCCGKRCGVVWRWFEMAAIRQGFEKIAPSKQKKDETEKEETLFQ